MNKNLGSFWISMGASIPLLFFGCFLSLIIRARIVFREWPRLSANDPSTLSQNAVLDPLTWLSYDLHLGFNLFFLTLFAMLLLFFPFLWNYSSRFTNKKYLRTAWTLSLVPPLAMIFCQNGRFIFWFLD
jgi:hypothetical protein